MRKGRSYVKDSGDFIDKVKHLRYIPEAGILVTADTAGVNPSISYEVGLNALRVALDNREHKSINADNITYRAEF